MFSFPTLARPTLQSSRSDFDLLIGTWRVSMGVTFTNVDHFWQNVRWVAAYFVNTENSQQRGGVTFTPAMRQVTSGGASALYPVPALIIRTPSKVFVDLRLVGEEFTSIHVKSEFTSFEVKFVSSGHGYVSRCLGCGVWGVKFWVRGVGCGA